MSDAQQNQQKYLQFVQLLPLTLAIAGLPQSEHGKYFNEDQMANRARTVKSAYRQARLLTREIVSEP